ncbi:hypothetical protein EK599_09680 [Vibrio sp. T187]|uniref:D-Ala-D-Ala carboxypeptidase family metallohydrolase n=1 Tax=Vibrio TaxID=662 RepID=UPI0010C9AED1|nr:MULTISPECIES: D-Ala-D-Ala carboxypeptidase family metallohydrolase [Vibrio]MBW3695966.1 hypothetical protein [Vibrio sp. T187]
MSLSLLLSLLVINSQPMPEEFSKLYSVEEELSYDDLVVDVHGYKVPTRTAFQGWVLLNHAEDKIKKIGNQLRDAGIQQSMPLHLILLQGTDWVMSNTALFTLPHRDHISTMINTLKFIQEYIEPEIGIVIPVSGERTDIYNKQAGGAARSKHLNFCALDLVPSQEIDRAELHKKLIAIHNKVGQKYDVGLGLYSGLRFHIDTCGFRRW